MSVQVNAQTGPEAAAPPYSYARRPLAEPDWRRLPGWRDVGEAQWRDARWQRAHCVKNPAQLRAVTGGLLAESFHADLAADAERFATMPMLIPPQMLNTMAPHATDPASFTEAFLADPVRRYMLPVASDRHPVWPSHPRAQRDSLHEAEMWAVEGLTHRYPTKVLAELLSTCPQYCGHCTRMDLVGTSTPQVVKARLALRPVDRQELILDYLKRTPGVRDVVVSGGDVANVPWPRLESFLLRLLELESVRDVRLATKALVGLPQHWLQPQVVEGVARVAAAARGRGVNLAVHTHANHARSVTPLVAEAARALLDAGVRDVRNQGVLMRGVNDTAADLLDLCFALQDEAGVLPYYFYLCDMIPNAEHWRTPLHQAIRLQEAIMGYLPGYATPRIVCDVPYVGKRWVHQFAEYDRERGISYWTRNHGIGAAEPRDLGRRFPFYDPIDTLPGPGRRFWAAGGDGGEGRL
ncbi:KamA family radical SAM protein [Bailinhaonella thermotolerans]|uniref:Lysine 2,3-aminomutase n=1 Tax=Bailinhaonella thermotolerans TaxID=1070861 RepID=A0A3A4AV36_9ACTN|nr:lysine 2,3-aminomutase [Bailinhaonella thermotolerans]RJL34090.1 lysine 2,3-aminomutase [Bailinhaonella thermotolerans]